MSSLKKGDIIFNTEEQINQRIVKVDKKTKTIFVEDIKTPFLNKESQDG